MSYWLLMKNVLEQIFNATHRLMWFLDMEGNLVETNDTALKFAGIKDENVI